MIDSNRRLGAMLGAAIGDALGMPIEGLSHQNVRTYYRGIKGLQRDKKRGDLEAGQWTFRTQLALRLGDTLLGRDDQEVGETSLRRVHPRGKPPPGAAPAAVLPIALHAEARGWTQNACIKAVETFLSPWSQESEALAAASGQVAALRIALTSEPAVFDRAAFMTGVTEATTKAEIYFGASDRCSRRLRAVACELGSFPLDLQDLCDGTGFAPDEAWPFAVAMFARNPALVEGTLLSSVNVGGDAPTIGACVGSLLGAFNGARSFPEEWSADVEGGAELVEMVEALHVGGEHDRGGG